MNEFSTAHGKSLLEVARNQQDFLGTKAENEDVENVDPEADPKNNTAPALETVREELAATTVEQTEKPKDEKLPGEGGDDKPAVEENDDNKEQATEKEDLNSENENDDEADDEEEEDISDQQLAYEMFELARGIFEARKRGKTFKNDQF